MSLGGGYSPLFATMAAKIRDAGALLVAAAGNSAWPEGRAWWRAAAAEGGRWMSAALLASPCPRPLPRLQLIASSALPTSQLGSTPRA